MSYTLTRQEAAILLNISTRSVDRYIKSGKIRAKKEGRIVLLNEQDIENIRVGDDKVELKQEIITPEQQKKQNLEEEKKSKISIKKFENNDKLNFIYEDLRNEIKQKDKKIETLSLQLGKMEEIVKNSISMIEYKKSQYLIEESKNNIKQELEKEKFEKQKIKMQLDEKSKLNIILSIIVVILLLISLLIWWILI